MPKGMEIPARRCDTAEMRATPRWGMTPRQSIERECREQGEPVVIAGCVDMLNGEDVDPNLIHALGGPPARWVVEGGEGGPEYWLRVWAARHSLGDLLQVLQELRDDPDRRVRVAAERAVTRITGAHG